jgi:hypothetical protein
MIPLYQFAPAVGQEVLFAGLPGTDAMIAHGWIVGVRPGTLISSIFPVGGGMSGGSLYTPDGRLYGVQARWKPATGASFSTSNGRIGQFLRDTYEIHKLPLPWQVMALTPNKTIDAPKEAVVATCNPPVQIVK